MLSVSLCSYGGSTGDVMPASTLSFISYLCLTTRLKFLGSNDVESQDS